MTDAGYAIVPRWMLRDERFTANMLLTYTALQSFADAAGSAFPSLTTLAKRAHLGTTATRTALRALEATGVVEITERRRADGGRRSNIYLVLTHDPTPPSPRVAPPSASCGEPPREVLGELTPEEQDPNEAVNGPAAPRRGVTRRQVEYLTDLHLHGGGTLSPEFTAWAEGLTAAEADAEIREALAVLPRGRAYEGSENAPGLSEKGREVAARRLIPGGDDA